MNASEPSANRTDPGGKSAARPTEQPLLITDDLLETPPVERRVDFEKGIAYWPAVTLCLVGLNVAVFIWEVATGALANAQAMMAAGALDKQEVVRGEYWRLLSAIFLHADLQHVAGDCAALYILGVACEHACGRFRSLSIYLLAGVAASLLSVFTEPGPTVGASGAIFGLMGCMATFLQLNRRRFYVRDARISAVLLVWSAYTLITGWFDAHIANMAHLGGFLAGSLLALAVKPTLRHRVV